MSGGKDDTVLAPTHGGTRFGEGAVDAEPWPTGVPNVGDLVLGKYEVGAILGLGGMGVVLAVTHTGIGERYAMKCLLPRGASDLEAVARFRREAQAAARIKSEHVGRVIDFGELDNGTPYLLMEHLSGRDLGEVLEHVGRLSVHDAVEYVLQACAGIAEAHALGIVHRDLKPSNLFLTQRLDGVALVKVLDFGISKAMDRELVSASPALTQTTSVFGSPAYMSPEQLRSTKNVDYRADVWGLGVILYELLTGTLPFKAETGSGLLAAIAADPPDSLRGHRPEVSEELEAVVMRCLEKDVKRRWQRVSDLAIALEPFRGEQSLVSIGRIVRLSGGPPAPIPALEVSSANASGEQAVGSATDGPVTTGARERAAKAGRVRALLVFASVAAVVGGAALLVRSPSTPPSALGALAPPSAPAPSSPEPSLSAEPVAVPTTSAVASASPTSPASPASPTSVAAKPRHKARAAASSRGMQPATPIASSLGVMPPPETPRDPTADSH